MIKPLEVEFTDLDDVVRKFTISRFPATEGMEILYRLPTTGIPKIGDFDKLKEVRNDVFKYIYVELDGKLVSLSTKALIDNHVGDAETALKVMGAILQHNFSFFRVGTISSFLKSFMAKVPQKVQEILAQSSPVSSKQNKQRTKS